MAGEGVQHEPSNGACVGLPSMLRQDADEVFIICIFPLFPPQAKRGCPSEAKGGCLTRRLCIRRDSRDEASPVCPLFACGGKRAGITLLHASL